MMARWAELTEEYKESNRLQANQIPEKLQRIGYGFAPSVRSMLTRRKFILISFLGKNCRYCSCLTTANEEKKDNKGGF